MDVIEWTKVKKYFFCIRPELSISYHDRTAESGAYLPPRSRPNRCSRSRKGHPESKKRWKDLSRGSLELRSDLRQESVWNGLQVLCGSILHSFLYRALLFELAFLNMTNLVNESTTMFLLSNWFMNYVEATVRVYCHELLGSLLVKGKGKINCYNSISYKTVNHSQLFLSVS